MSELIWTPVKVRLGQIIKWEHNPRMSTKVQAQRLIKSERELGQIQTVAISPFDENGFCNLYDGHQRVSAWLTVKGADYEVNALQSNRHLTEDERKKVSVLLHTATGSWSWDALSSWSAADLKEWGMDKDTLKGWREDAKELTDLLNSEEESVSVDAEPQIDRAEELLAKWQVKTGDLWQIGEHRLLCGDSTKREDVERLMGGERADMTFIDPPYGVDYEGGAQNEKKREKIKGDSNGNLYLPILSLCKEFSKKSSPMYVWFADRCGKPVYDAVESIGYNVRAMIIWNKLDAHYGAFMAQYMQKHESCLYITDGNSNFIGASNEVTVWDIKQPSKNEFHPTQKPIELALRAIKNHDAPIVIDFCCGSGTSMMACENLKRKCRAIEILPAYCSVILERMSTAFPELEIKRLNGTS